ncbi:MAG: hypothetical protein IKB72_01970, partial [Ruminococcus sp.]|nr:hypothetical protein [Ruminococcus sp.]
EAPAPEVKNPEPQKPAPQKPVTDDTKPGTEQLTPKFDLGEFEYKPDPEDTIGTGELIPAPIKDHNYHDWVGFN